MPLMYARPLSSVVITLQTKPYLFCMIYTRYDGHRFLVRSNNYANSEVLCPISEDVLTIEIRRKCQAL